MGRLRLGSQIIFFLIFLILFLKTTYNKNNLILYPVKVFLDIDPFIFISIVFSLHSLNVPTALFYSIVIIVLTIFLGRFFCGWICPFGTINHFVSSIKNQTYKFKEKKIIQDSSSLLINSQSQLISYRFKYYLLLFLLTTSFFSLQLSGIFDPLSLLIRSLTISIFPALQYSIFLIFDFLNISPSKLIPYFSLNKLLYFQAPFISIIFFIILSLNLSQNRYFCRNLCPLGALFGILAIFSPLKFKIKEDCKKCNRCLNRCQGGLTNKDGLKWLKSECILCGNCLELCLVKAIEISFYSGTSVNKQFPDLKKRQTFITLASGIMAVPFLNISPSERLISSEIIRPPGALAEEDFLKRCIRCGECLKVCLTNGLQPTLFELGFKGIWSPKLVPRLGYCAYNCILCGQVCPTGAIKKLTPEEKAEFKIGLAFIDKNRCLPYAFGKSCMVCEEHCPTPRKAIWFKEIEILDRKGIKRMIKQPVIDPELCIGCGICEYKCPLKDQPAIRITSAGETRSRKNQPFLF